MKCAALCAKAFRTAQFNLTSYRRLLAICRDRLRGGLGYLKLGAHLFHLSGLLFELSHESLYFLLLLRDRRLQFFEFFVEHSLFRGIGSGRRGRWVNKFTRVGGAYGERAQASIRIDQHEMERPCIDWLIVDVVDKAPVTYLAKDAVHTGQMADHDIVIGGRETTPSVSA
jgi:hypothetical protein